MNRPGQSLPRSPGLAIKIGVSTLILVHFFAIFTAVTSGENPRFPAPPIAKRLNEWWRWYLGPTFLSSPYRFYAPDPGPTSMAWFRLEYADGSVLWYEFPRRREYALRMPYQRNLSVTMLSVTHVMADPDAPPVTLKDVLLNQPPPPTNVFTPSGQICFASFARHVAKSHPRFAADGALIPVQYVDIFHVQHAPLWPPQIKMGWDHTDIRLYISDPPVHFGRYKADGTRLDGTKNVARRMSELVADILKIDLYPALEKAKGKPPLQTAEQLGLPDPVLILLERFPQLLNPKLADDDLPAVIREVVDKSDKAEVRATMVPGVDYPLDW